MNKLKVYGLLAVSLFIAAVLAQDGAVYRSGSWSEIGTGKTASPFERGIAPSDGGRLTVRAGAKLTAVDVTGVTLGGIDFAARTTNYKLYQEAITLTGNASIRNPVSIFDYRTVYVSLLTPFTGTSATTLSVYGGAPLLFGSTYSGIGAYAISESTVTVTNEAAAFLSGDLSLDAAGLYYAPGGADGALETTLGSGATLAYGNGGNEFGIAKGSHASAQVTVGKLERKTNGLLALVPGSGAAALGSTEKFLVTDATSVPRANGVVDASVTVRDFTVAGWPLTFAAYDAANGFTAYEPTKSIDEATATEIAKVASDTELAASKSVLGVRVDGGAKLTVPTGTTLTVGDGEHVAAVIVNGAASSAKDQQQQLAGGGEIAFGTSEGVLYGAAGGTNCSVSVSPRLSGSKGVTFAGQTSLAGEPITFSFASDYAAGWTGPTWVTDAILSCAGNPFPAGGDVYLLDGQFYGGSQVKFTEDVVCDQTFHLRGSGPHGALGHGILYASGKKATLEGPLVIENGDSWIGGSNWSTFNCFAPIEGDGSLALYRTKINSYATNTYAGKIVIDISSSFNVISNGTLHAGAVSAGDDVSDSALTFSHLTHDCLAVTNAITLPACGISVENSSLALLGPVKAATFKAIQATVAVGTNVAFGAIDDATDGNAVISAARDDSSLTVGSAADSAIDLLLDDGDGKLGLVKTGSSTVTLSRQQAYTGATVVRDGTLKLLPGLLGGTDVLYWLDASDATTYDRDADGYVTRWRSKNGNGYAFTPATYPTSGTVTTTLPGPTVTRTLNDLPVMSFTTAERNRLMGSAEVCQRTVFIVNVPINNSTCAGIFGPAEDTGVRTETYTDDEGYANFWSWGSHVTTKHGTCFNLGPYVNGTERNTFVNRQPQVLSFELSKNFYPNGWTTGYRPYLGGYYPWTAGGTYGARNFNGDIAEVIAFNRALSTAERNAVEKYLADKWGIALAVTPTGKLADYANVLNPATDVTLEGDGVLDLNGANETVASLAGQGIIRNSSTTPATLRVTGACTFSGKIEGQVTLIAAGSGAKTLSLAVDASAALAVNGGTATVDTYAFQPPQSGLAIWLDASHPETIVTNASGTVTQWKSLAGKYPEGLNAALKLNSSTTVDRPSQYSLTGFNGKPGVYFGFKQAIYNASICQRSVYYVFYRDGSTGYIWGIPTEDAAIRVVSGAMNLYGLDFLGSPIDYVIDGVVRSTVVPADQAAHCFSIRINDAVANSYVGSVDGLPSKGYCLGRNSWNSNIYMWVGEVLVYERRLTDEEDTLVRDYLTAKWVNSPAGQLAVATRAFAEGAGFAAGEGTQVDLSAAGTVKLSSLASSGAGGTVTGDIELDGAFTFDANDAASVAPLTVNGNLVLGSTASARVLRYGSLSKRASWPVLAASGSVSGAFGSVTWDGSGSKRWELNAMATGWKLFCPSGLLLIFK